MPPENQGESKFESLASKRETLHCVNLKVVKKPFQGDEQRASIAGILL